MKTKKEQKELLALLVILINQLDEQNNPKEKDFVLLCEDMHTMIKKVDLKNLLKTVNEPLLEDFFDKICWYYKDNDKRRLRELVGDLLTLCLTEKNGTTELYELECFILDTITKVGKKTKRDKEAEKFINHEWDYSAAYGKWPNYFEVFWEQYDLKKIRTLIAEEIFEMFECERYIRNYTLEKYMWDMIEDINHEDDPVLTPLQNLHDALGMKNVTVVDNTKIQATD